MTTEEKVDDFLEHVGVKGMRWGVRKGPSARKQKKQRKQNLKSTVKSHRKSRAFGEKSGIALVTLGAGYIAYKASGTMFKSPLIKLGVAGASAAVGKDWVERRLDKERGRPTIAELRTR